jgi:hypothetical protein
MKDFEKYNEETRMRWERRMEHRGHHGRGGRVWAGLFLVIVGGLFLMKSLAVPLPAWLFTWQVLVIGLGLFIGLKHGFRRGGWLAPILVGGIFLTDQYFLNNQLHGHIWPVILIILGLSFIFRPKRRYCDRNHWREKKNAARERNMPLTNEESISQDDYIDLTTIFSGSKKNILSKDFKGGDIVNIFGGTELNLSQADINGKAELEVTAIFGGAKLTVPSNWVIKSEATVTIFGGIEDKRSGAAITENADKILVLKGTVIFGGIEIRSF